MRKFDLYHEAIHVNARITKLKDDAGYCEERVSPELTDEGHISAVYLITVAQNQTIRDFATTVVHEMVHVKQYVTGQWTGDGEEEAWRLQEQLVEEMWKQNLI